MKCYDRRIQNGEDEKILAEANKKILSTVKAESDQVLGKLLENASNHMKTRYHRGDN